MHANKGCIPFTVMGTYASASGDVADELAPGSTKVEPTARDTVAGPMSAMKGGVRGGGAMFSGSGS